LLISSIYRFLGGDNTDTFFANKDRQRIVCEILETTVYGKREKAEIGIERLLENNVYLGAFPLHEVSVGISQYVGHVVVGQELIDYISVYCPKIIRFCHEQIFVHCQRYELKYVTCSHFSHTRSEFEY
jgi:hypothetical protein